MLKKWQQESVKSVVKKVVAVNPLNPLNPLLKNVAAVNPLNPLLKFPSSRNPFNPINPLLKKYQQCNPWENKKNRDMTTLQQQRMLLEIEYNHEKDIVVDDHRAEHKRTCDVAKHVCDHANQCADKLTSIRFPIPENTLQGLLLLLCMLGYLL